jgi:calcineurin-like phosphoesterase family protein
MDLGNLNADKLFLISDTHFSHVNIIEYCKRPFGSLEEMNAEMVARWIATVPADATVLHLGDFAMGKIDDRVLERYSHLPGQKILVAGNHDKTLIKRGYAQKLFHVVCDQARFVVNGHEVVASHYPFDEWREEIHLHGHTHGKSDRRVNRLDVGVDAFGFACTYAPRPWAEILEWIPR